MLLLNILTQSKDAMLPSVQKFCVCGRCNRDHS